jgi:hypothetical protein
MRARSTRRRPQAFTTKSAFASGFGITAPDDTDCGIFSTIITLPFFCSMAELSGNRRRRGRCERLRSSYLCRQGGSPGLLEASARMTWCARVFWRASIIQVPGDWLIFCFSLICTITLK